MNTSLMRNGIFGMFRHVKRQELYLQASKAATLQRELVQRSLHQLAEYNEESHGAFVKPMLALKKFEDNWAKNTEGICAEEQADLQ